MNEPVSATNVLPMVRLLLLAFVAGQVVLGSTFVFLRGSDPAKEIADPPIVTYVLVGVAGTLLPLAFLARRVIERISIRQWRGRRDAFAPERDLPPEFLKVSLVSAAILEAGGMKCLVGYFLEGHVAALVMAGVLVGSIMSLWPTSEGLSAWYRRMTRAILGDGEEEQGGWPEEQGTL